MSEQEQGTTGQQEVDPGQGAPDGGGQQPDTISLPQAALDKRIAQAKRVGGDEAVKALLADLGVDDPEQAKAIFAAHRQREEQQRTEAEKASRAAEQAQRKLAEAEARAEAAEARAVELERRQAFAVAAAAADIPADRVDAAYRLAEWGEGVEPEAAVKAVIEANPFLAAEAPGKPQTHGGDGRGSQQRQSPVTEQEANRTRWDAIAGRQPTPPATGG